MFSNWREYFSTIGYRAKAQFETRPIKDMKFTSQHAQIFQFREHYNGAWTSPLLTQRGRNVTAEGTGSELKSLYSSLLPITAAKYQDLQVLKKFCAPEAHIFFQVFHTCRKRDNKCAFFLISEHYCIYSRT